MGAGKASEDVKNIFKGKGNIGKEIAELAEDILPEAAELVAVRGKGNIGRELVPLVAVRMQEEEKCHQQFANTSQMQTFATMRRIEGDIYGTRSNTELRKLAMTSRKVRSY